MNMKGGWIHVHKLIDCRHQMYNCAVFEKCLSIFQGGSSVKPWKLRTFDSMWHDGEESSIGSTFMLSLEVSFLLELSIHPIVSWRN